MLTSEGPTPNEVKSSRRRINWELYYYERVGDRLYFRITPFAIILMLVAALAGVTIIIIDLRKNPPRETNINVTVPPTTSYPANNSMIRRVPPPPRANKQPAIISPSPLIQPSNNSNMNKPH